MTTEKSPHDREPVAESSTTCGAIGLFLPTMAEVGAEPVDVAAAARHAEALGFESIWAIDQLIAGTGVPILDSTVALAVAAGATSRIRLGYGVMVLPLRPVVWAAKQVASLQIASGGRVVLGVGVGGDRHARSWDAAGVPRSERGARTDAALAVLPDLIAGRSIDLNESTVQLSPGSTVPPIVVGGAADAALARAVDAGGWFALPLPPAELEPARTRLAALARERGRATPALTASLMVAIDGDNTVPEPDELADAITDPDGRFGMPAEAVPSVLVTGGVEQVAERIRRWFDAGAARVVVSVVAGDWSRQAELVAAARDALESAPTSATKDIQYP